MPPDASPATTSAASAWVLADLARGILLFALLGSVLWQGLTPWPGPPGFATAATLAIAVAAAAVTAPLVVRAKVPPTTRARMVGGLGLLAAACSVLLALTGGVTGGVVPLLLLAVACASLALLPAPYDALLPWAAERTPVGPLSGLGASAAMLGGLVGLVLVLQAGPTTGVIAASLLMAVTTLAVHRAIVTGDDLSTVPSVPERHGPPPGVRTLLSARFLYVMGGLGTVLMLPAYLERWMQADPAVFFILLALGAAGASGLSAPAGILVHRIGPRHTLVIVLLVWAFGLGVAVSAPFTGLTWHVFYPLSALLGGAWAAARAADRAFAYVLMGPYWTGRVMGHHSSVGLAGLVAGGVLWAVVTHGAGLPLPVAGLLFFLAVLAGAVLVLALPDPVRPGPHPLGAHLPWRSVDGRPLPLPPRWGLRFPGTLLYAAVSTTVFLAILRLWGPGQDGVEAAVIPLGRLQVPVTFLVYQIPVLFTNIPKTLLNFVTVIWINPHPVQLVYVLLLLALFGAIFEIREGGRRFWLIFLGTSIASAILAGALLHILHWTVDAPWVEDAWRRHWAGGSAGAFGLMGAVAARARRPWLLLSLMLAWEINVEVWVLRSYTAAFHLIALVLGFVAARKYMPLRTVSQTASEPNRPDGVASDA